MKRDAYPDARPETRPTAPEALRDEDLLRVAGGHRKAGGCQQEFLTITMKTAYISG